MSNHRTTDGETRDGTRTHYGEHNDRTIGHPTTARVSPSEGSIPIEAKVGQLFHIGFDGTSPTAELKSLVRERHVGGVIYFDRNLETPAQTRSLTKQLQQIATGGEPGLPLLISIDQEGGIVRRLPYYPPIPGAMAVGATDDPRAAATVAEVTANQLRSVGVNWNLAPVLDVNSDPDNPVIGVRAYGEDPNTVATFGARYVEALQAHGVAACGKHFPGHGATTVDSHEDLPVVTADETRLDRVELAPFRRAIDAGVDTIMTAHVAFPAITESRSKPATLSPAVLSDCLRDDLGFDGVIVTDCLEMDAIADGVGTAQGAVEAIAAGADGVLVSHTPTVQERAIDAVLDAVDRGQIPISRIDDAFDRIHSLKQERELRPNASAPTCEQARSRVRSIAERAVTLLSDRADRLPLSPQNPVVVAALLPAYKSPVEADRSYVSPLTNALQAHGFDVSTVTVSREQWANGTVDLTAKTEGHLLCCTTDVAKNGYQYDIVESLLGAGLDPIVLAVRSPYDIRRLPDVGTCLTTYGSTSMMLEALAAILAGERSPEGRPPPSLR